MSVHAIPPRRKKATFPRTLATYATAGLLATLQACDFDNRLAGGSSEVDNPQIKVAFVDDAGHAAAFTGSVSLFVADQNPALTPDPLLELNLAGDTAVFLNGALLAKTGNSSFNLLARGKTGTGAFVGAFSYDSASRNVTVGGEGSDALRARLVPLVRYSGTVDLPVNGPERVFIPGTPYQSVVVADSFAFDDLPTGVFSVRVYGSDGVERELAGLLDTRQPRLFSVDTTVAPIPRDPPPPLELAVEAGESQSVFTNSETFLSGDIAGINRNDKRLGILWRQVPSGEGEALAVIENPVSLSTRVTFPEPGVYRFVLSATVGPQKAEDTVSIGVQSAPILPVFFNPNPWDTIPLWTGYPYEIRWYSQTKEPEALDLEFSSDSGATWEPLYDGTVSVQGFNERLWFPGETTQNGFLRLRDDDGTTLAVSRRFAVTTPPGGQGNPALWTPETFTFGPK